jgi:NAD(P)-dependent dehydrogenase (short-subunit alcohol dehydrogenase family)
VQAAQPYVWPAHPYAAVREEALMGTRLAGKVAVVTGSTSGIGRASAELFAEQGARVVINGRRRALGQQVVDGIVERGGTASYFYADVRQADQLRALIRYAVDTYGRLDILMNNAFSGRHGSAVDLSEEDWEATYAVTVRAVFLASKYAIPEMIRGGRGAILNVGSHLGLVASRRNAAYAAFKAAVIHLSRQMAVDYGAHGIRVNAMCPARIVTEAKQEMLDANPAAVRDQKYTYPLGRPGTMREAAMAALFLVSDESSFVTGAVLSVDGGMTAQAADGAAGHLVRGVLDELGIEGT